MPKPHAWPQYAAFLLWLTNPPPDGLGLADATALARAGAMSGLFSRGVQLTAASVALAIAAEPAGRRAYVQAGWRSYARWQGLTTLDEAEGIKRPRGRPKRGEPIPRARGGRPASTAPASTPQTPPAPVWDDRQRERLALCVLLCRGPWAIGTTLLSLATWADVQVSRTAEGTSEVRLSWPDGRLTEAITGEGRAALTRLHLLAGSPGPSAPLLGTELSPADWRAAMREALTAHQRVQPDPVEARSIQAPDAPTTKPTAAPLPGGRPPR
jgi:hypothetical protein